MSTKNEGILLSPILLKLFLTRLSLKPPHDRCRAILSYVLLQTEERGHRKTAADKKSPDSH